MADQIITTVAQIEVGQEIIIHAPVAGEFADMYLTIDEISRDSDGIVLVVTDRNRDQHVVAVPGATLAYRYA